MKKIFKITVIFYFLINVFNFSSGSENFFNKGLELYNKKNLKMLDLCLREVLYLIQNTLIHIYI